MDPIVITNQEVERAQVPVQGAQEVRPKIPNPVPVWARLLFAPLVLILPLLSLAALIMRVAVRGQAPRVRQSWSSYLLTLLIITLVVIGSLWIMSQLNHHMMPMDQLMQMQR